MVLGQGETFSGYTLNVEVSPGETATANLSALQALTAQGSVVLAGEPLPNTKITIVSETDPAFPAQTVESNADGQFSIEGLLPDSYQLSASYESEAGNLATQLTLKLEANVQPPPVLVNLTPPSSVQFTVDSGATLAPGTPIMLMHKQTRQLTTAQWVNGQLEAEVPPGEYEVWQGDAVGGTAIVSEDATGVIRAE